MALCLHGAYLMVALQMRLLKPLVLLLAFRERLLQQVPGHLVLGRSKGAGILVSDLRGVLGLFLVAMDWR